MKAFLAMLSVPHDGGHVTAIVPTNRFFAGDALQRLMDDDPLWFDNRDKVKLHWVFQPSPGESRVSVRDRIACRFVPSEATS